MSEISSFDVSPIVFVVDDDEVSLTYFRSTLGRAGLLVETFQRAEAFLDRLGPSDVGCLLLDVRMPEISGLELQRRLVETNCPIPIILISGDADVESCSRAFRAGAFDFVEKSIAASELVKLTRRALEEGVRLHSIAAHRMQVRTRSALLTARERDVKELMLRGCSIKEIAFRLGVAFQTAAKHRSRVLEKMQVASDAELIRLEAGELSENRT